MQMSKNVNNDVSKDLPIVKSTFFNTNPFAKDQPNGTWRLKKQTNFDIHVY